jgi:DUF971 family protein
MSNQYQVESLKQIDKTTLGITFKDGHQSRLPVRLLRLKCPCAKCIDEMTGEVLIKEGQVPADVRPIKIEPVGRYALRFRWSDGHDTGIYTFESLRALEQK